MADQENIGGRTRLARARTTTPVRRSNTSDRMMSAQASLTRDELDAALVAEAQRQDESRRASERLTNETLTEHTTALQDLFARLDDRDAEQIQRDDRTQVQMANLASMIATLQTLLTSAPTTTPSTVPIPIAGATGTGTGAGTSGTTPATGAASSATIHPGGTTRTPATTVAGTAGVATAVTAGVATAVTAGLTGAGAGAGIPMATTAPVAGAAVTVATNAAPASSAHTTATSGGMPAVGPGTLSIKDIKIPALPLLGRPPNALPYVKWTKAVRVKLSAIGAGAVLNQNWNPTTPDENQWWEAVNPLIFAALYESIQNNDTLSDNLSRFCEVSGSGRLAWNAIKAFHVKLAEGNKESLQIRLNSLIPGEKESMESFLCRCNNLREEYKEYNLVLEDSLLISHLFLQIDQTWRWMSGFSDIPTSVLNWEDVSDALQKQDNQRRQGQRQNPLILPLGWVPRDLYNKSKVAAAHVSDGESSQKKSTPEGEKEGAANAAQGSTKWKGKGKQNSGGEKKSDASPGAGYPKVGQFFICYCCLEFGHGLQECPNKPPGWKLTSEQRAKALALRDAKCEKYGRPRAAPVGNVPPVL